MNTLIFASNNLHKVSEIKNLCMGHWDIQSLAEAGIEIEIPEPYLTLEENAKEKAVVINKLTGRNCFGEDTGLEVEALNGQPGVLSARYAGVAQDDASNIKKLLHNLEKITKRKAQFRTIIFLLLNGSEYYFEGICEGSVTTKEKGSKGFGYDSIFVPKGASKTFAEMDLTEKNLYSHRQKAATKLFAFLSRTGKK